MEKKKGDSRFGRQTSNWLDGVVILFVTAIQLGTCLAEPPGRLGHQQAARGNSRDGKPKTLSLGSVGQDVETLQRTLNARLSPSPKLSVDGDFGPATQAAVFRLQEQFQLKKDGVVDHDDWKALGTLVTSPKVVPGPASFNQQEQGRSLADPLDGPPFVTAKAWVIAELATGKVLYESNKDKVLDIASTTKIMTAFLIFEFANNDPSILLENITFSSKADKTRGSTSGIRAGETLSVKELLYGLLLPSGNDASVAFAEHFGSRMANASRANSKEKAGDELFVAVMNQRGRQIGMKNTVFKNPHGLTAAGHRSTAADLVLLATAAMKLKSFREYVSTRQFGCEVRSVKGDKRNVAWKNTNQLLGIEGYIGIKTGTTAAAGACLVSASKRSGKELVMVVLGSGSSRGRYVDSRNLYRWAWQKQEKERQP